jgi:hypothetical protein
VVGRSESREVRRFGSREVGRKGVQDSEFRLLVLRL